MGASLLPGEAQLQLLQQLGDADPIPVVPGKGYGGCAQDQQNEVAMTSYLL